MAGQSIAVTIVSVVPSAISAGAAARLEAEALQRALASGRFRNVEELARQVLVARCATR